MIEIKGILHFDPVNISRKHNKQASWKKIAIIKLQDDTDLELNRSIRGSHVTLISDIVDDVIWEEARKVFDGSEISVFYDPEEVRTNGTHWWLKIYSKDSENIRVSMGLDPTPYFNFHLTIGYANNRNIEHSEYILSCIKKFNL